MEFQPSPDFRQFLSWEVATRDTLDVKRIYIDLARDLAAGVMLSEIIFWYLPDRNGKSKLRVVHEGRYWIAVQRAEWWERCRISPEQADYALGKLVKKELIEKHIFKFNGQPTVHIRLLEEPFLAQLAELLEHPATNPYQPKSRDKEVSHSGMGNFPNGNGNPATPDWENHPNPLTETTDINPPPPPADPSQKSSDTEPASAYPATPLEAASHPDLVLFQQVTDGLFPGKRDWQVIIDRIQFLRQKHLGLDDEHLALAGKPYWQAWVERKYSPTHPDFLEWWMNGRIPPQKRKRKNNKPDTQETEADLEAHRQRGRELLLPFMETVQKEHQEA